MPCHKIKKISELYCIPEKNNLKDFLITSQTMFFRIYTLNTSKNSFIFVFTKNLGMEYGAPLFDFDSLNKISIWQNKVSIWHA